MRLPTFVLFSVSVFAVSVFAISVFTSTALADIPLTVGMAETDITPPEGFPIAGYYHERLATGSIDPLKAKAIVFRQGSTSAALVVCDLGAIAVDLSHLVRQQAAERTGIPAKNIVISGTHSHTAPDYFRDLYLYLAGQRENKIRSDYIAKLIEATTQSIVHADKAAQPASLKAGIAEQKLPVAFNRRFVMKDGSVRTWMKNSSAGVVRAAGPIDPDIPILRINSADGKLTSGVFSNFALHLDTVGGLKWSADYPYFIEQAVRNELGKDVVSLFGTGCCGDINHTDPDRADRNKTDTIGNALGESVVAKLGDLYAVAGSDLRVESSVVKLPLQTVEPEQLEPAIKLLTAAKNMEKVDFYEQVTAYKHVMLDQFRATPSKIPHAEHVSWGVTHRWRGVGAALPVEVHAFCIGEDVAIVCLPGEVFVELGLAIKQGSPFRTTFVVELSNCAETLYIPNRGAYAQGSYEVTNSALQPGAGEMLVEASLKLLRQAAGTK